MKTIDQLPSFPESECADERRPRRKADKPFSLERRYVGHSTMPIFAWLYNREWHAAGSYATERGRDDALRTLQHKKGGRWEYRIPLTTSAAAESR